MGRVEDILLSFVAAHPRAGRAVARLASFVTLAVALCAGAPAAADGGGDASGARAAPVSGLLHDDRAIVTWLKQRHHALLAAQARVAQARADVGAARILLPNPQVDVTLGGIGVGRGNYTLPPGTPLGFNDTSNIGVGITQTIELGKRGPRVEAAELRAESAGKGWEDALGDRVAEARSALARVAYLKARMVLLEDNMEGARRSADLQKARLDRGAVSGSDYDRLLLDNISLEADIARARADLEAALSTCAGIMLAPCDAAAAQIADVDAAAPLPAQVAAMSDEIDKRPDVQAARLEGAAAEKDAVLAERRAIPDPSLRVGFTHDNYLAGGSQPNTFQITLTVPLPIFDHGQHDAAKARARALEQRYVANGLAAVAQRDFAGLLSRKAFVESARRTLDTVAVPKSTGILDATTKAFEQGQVSMTDLLLARRTHLSLVLTQMDLHFEHFSVRSDLRHTLALDAVAPSGDAGSRDSAGPSRPPAGSR
ncbi:Heavy metal RND efflux outer membrane protein, CzcC family protein [Minicystis rosea]|nr:Heavy metal RND efflux outer membrane protein, CzcC family protein [Minicystis rosea]